jgi:hypothetical protein
VRPVSSAIQRGLKLAGLPPSAEDLRILLRHNYRHVNLKVDMVEWTRVAHVAKRRVRCGLPWGASSVVPATLLSLPDLTYLSFIPPVASNDST